MAMVGVNIRYNGGIKRDVHYNGVSKLALQWSEETCMSTVGVNRHYCRQYIKLF